MYETFLSLLKQVLGLVVTRPNLLSSYRVVRDGGRHLFMSSTSNPVDEGWLTTFNGGIIKQGVQLALFNGGLRGVVATAPTSSTAPVVLVKADVALEVTNNRPPTPFADFAPQDFWSSCMWDQRLGLKLLHELKNISATSKMGWISQLPESFNTPIHWSSQDIDFAQYTPLNLKVTAQRDSWSSFYRRWQGVTSPRFRDLVSQADMYRVLECCNSRAFSGAYEGSSPQDRKALLVFTVLLAVVWPLLQLSSVEQSVGLGVTVGLSVVLRDFFLSNFANLKRYVLCPYVDMFNHRSDARSDVAFNYFSNQFELCVLKDYQPGEQVFISYGKPSNDRLLQFYGFVEAGNPNDLYDFGSTLPEVLLTYGDAVAKQVQFPASPASRLQFIAAAVRNTDVMSRKAGARSEMDMVQVQSSSLASGGAGGGGAAMENINLRYYRTPIGGSAVGISAHYDDVSVRCLRLFFASETEFADVLRAWKLPPDSKAFSESASVNLDCVSQPLSASTEAKIDACLRAMANEELRSKPTSLEADEKQARTALTEAQSLALEFRIEKKRLLVEASNNS